MATGRVPTTANSPLTTKGDLFGYSTAPARLAVGSNGDTIVADSSTATGLRYQTGVSTNSIINGGMDIWQRGTTFTNPTVANYTADRFMINRSGDASGATVSRTTSAPTGFLYAMQWQRTAGNTGTQSMEIYYGLESNDSYRFAGQTATLSFYAKKGANYSGGDLAFRLQSGTATDAKPYASSTNVATGAATLTTSYQRFTVTGTFASNITQAFFNIAWTPTGTAGADDSVYITGIQLELGSVATTFKRAGGTIQGELAACQRYYYRTSSNSAATFSTVGGASSATNAFVQVRMPQTMRTTPSTIDFSTLQLFVLNTVGQIAATNVTFSVGNENNIEVAVTVASGLTSGQIVNVRGNGSGAYLGFSAEL